MTKQSKHSEFLSKKLSAITGGHIAIRGEFSQDIGEVKSDLACTVTINDKVTFEMAAQSGVLGLCEAYLQGYWDVDDLVVLVRIFSRNRFVLDRLNQSVLSRVSQLFFRLWYWRSRNNKQGSKKNIAAHYDLSNDFFKLWLDSRMMYSSAIYDEEHTTLERASEKKLKTICEKLQLSEDDKVIEIGSGWGGFAIYAAQNYGCHVTTTTISQAQYDEAKQRIIAAGLEHKIRLVMQDYRELTGQYDKLVSIEMIEAVGHQYLDTYFSRCQSLLKSDGLGLIQAITIEDTRYQKALKTVDFIKRYVFPGSFIPCNSVLVNQAAAAGLKIIDLQDIGASYAKTLADWRVLFLQQEDAVRSLNFDDYFLRLWDFYLCYCQGGFEEGVISDVHLLFKNSMRVK